MTQPEKPEELPEPSANLHGFLMICLMLLGVFALYCPVQLLSGRHMLSGTDYVLLHMHRIRYAREALFGAHPHLPAWYTRELLGSPFWSNVQNFPFIPTRLPLLLMNPLFAYAVGVNLAAALAALFTYLYCRRIGLARLSAAVSGWTFAASGFFASRVMAGHLPLLEAYPALPLLLWLVEKAVLDPLPHCRFYPWLLTLGLASGCITMAGHPQLPAYAIGTVIFYLLYRAHNRQGLKALGAILLGVGSAGFVLWPMFQLVCRSTRLLPLDAPDNNILFPYGRLPAFLFPWKNGFPNPFDSTSLFTGYPNDAFFWDTVCYVGWLPLLALVFLAIRQLRRRKLPDSPWPFFILLGILTLISALPFAERVLSLIPGTILRSPSRQIYLTTFALALALGAATDVLLSSTLLKRISCTWELTGLALFLHVVDLSRHDLHFVHPSPIAGFSLDTASESLRQRVGDGRIAVDCTLLAPLNREIDDVGFFDSIMLARPYRALLDLTGAPPGLNIQVLNGSQLSPRALAATATKVVVTITQRRDLPSIGGDNVLHIYAVPSPAPQATFLPLTMASYLDEMEIHERLRNPQFNPQLFIMLPRNADKPERPRSGSLRSDFSVAYERRSSDVILVKVRSSQAGFIRVIESFDPGWSATVDGASAPVLPADDFLLAVPLDPGTHEVRFSYATPGAKTGVAISLLSFPLLLLLAFSRARRSA
jgi:hypothetical protein